jgi:hypothetical protein
MSAGGADAYAAAAMAGPLVPVSTLPGRRGMETILLSGLVNASQGTPFALKVAQACAGYWLSPPMAFGGTGTGAASVMAGLPMLVAGLVALFASPQGTPSSTAQRMAQLMDAATRTVIVQVLIPPSPSPVPMPLT